MSYINASEREKITFDSPDMGMCQFDNRCWTGRSLVSNLSQVSQLGGKQQKTMAAPGRSQMWRMWTKQKLEDLFPSYPDEQLTVRI